MKICIITKSVTAEVEALVNAALRVGHEVSVANPFDLEFSVSADKMNIFFEGRDLLSYDAYILRSVAVRIGNNRVSHKEFIAKYLIDNNKTIIDERSSQGSIGSGKLVCAYKYMKASLPIVPTIYILRINSLSELEDMLLRNNVTLPFIMKDNRGKQGRNIYKIEDFSEVEEIMRNNENIEFVIQPFLDIDKDLRILVVGNKAIGAMNKVHKAGDFRGNISAGATGEKYMLNDELKDLAVRSAQASGLDVAGVDIAITKNGEKYLLEVNSVPQFKGFIEYTKVDVAGEIISYLENKFKVKNG